MSTSPDEDHARRTERPGEPPTLPLPPRWRLVVAAVAVLVFLYLMYHTYTDPPETLPAQAPHSSLAVVSSRA
jgi:hypothetical protein